jgi:hypothetical protein
MTIIRIGLDTAKHVFQVHGVDENEQTVVRRQLRRSKMGKFFNRLAPTRIGLEACGASHYWARLLRGLGHEVVLLPPQYIKPYVRDQLAANASRHQSRGNAAEPSLLIGLLVDASGSLITRRQERSAPSLLRARWSLSRRKRSKGNCRIGRGSQKRRCPPDGGPRVRILLPPAVSHLSVTSNSGAKPCFLRSADMAHLAERQDRLVAKGPPKYGSGMTARMSLPVTTRCTPAIASAAAPSIWRICPCGIVLQQVLVCSMPGRRRL